MASYSFVLVVLLLLVIHVDGEKHSREYRSRRFWKTIKDKLTNKFHIDFRHFDDEGMVLFPDVAFQSIDNEAVWKLMIHGWRFESHKSMSWLGITVSEWVERFAKNFLPEEAMIYFNDTLNRDRLKPFFVEDESNELIIIKIGSKVQVVQSDKQGQFYEQIEITNDEIQKLKQQQQLGEAISYEATGDNKDRAQGVIRLIEPRQGISVISDVDDTIKISEVLDKVRLIANTFIHPFKPVPGKYDN